MALSRLVVVGARGRLGASIVAAARTQGLEVDEVGRGDDLAALCARGESWSSTRPLSSTTVVVDAALPEAIATRVKTYATAGVAVVIATTGMTAEGQAAIDQAAEHIPLLQSANLSPGAHWVAYLATLSAQAMPSADVEIVEVHHRKKKDAPSGTALMLANSVDEGRGISSRLVLSREGVAPRLPGDIGIVAVRGGDVVGEHMVTFFVDGERVELCHKVSDRSVFATGALLAARFLAGRAPGKVTMQDVLRSSKR
jgi:4-hydroxy-tetrahydrodipicolinate reductase